MFAGICRHPQSPPIMAWATPETMLSRLYPGLPVDLAGAASDDRHLLVEKAIFNTPQSQQAGQVPLVDGALRVAFWGRLDNRDELAGLVPLERPLAETSDAMLVLAGWRTWGEGLAERLCGDFALAIIDTGRSLTYLARDPMGIKPLYYWAHEDAFLFATTPVALLELQHARPGIDPSWLARFVLGISGSADGTAFSGVRKLPGGHWLSLHEGQAVIRQYHHWRDDAPFARRRDNRWVEAYRAVLERVMQDQLVSAYPLGVEISGGIDSSTIASYIGRFMGPPGDRVHAFGRAILSDEPAYILEPSRVAGFRHNHITTERGAPEGELARVQHMLDVLGYPEEHGMGSAHDDIYRHCNALGIRTLFSGYGGDEVVTNYARNVYRDLLDNGAWLTAATVIGGHPLLRPLRLIRQHYKDRRSDGYHTGFIVGRRLGWAYQPINDEVVAALDMKREYMDHARYDTSFRRHNDWLINGMMKLNYVPLRLESCTLMAAARGVDYRWPLWDKRLVQQYLSTPVIERLGPGSTTRYLHRRAVTGVVPDIVAWKPSKWMGDPVNRGPLEDDHNQLPVPDDRAGLHPLLREVVDERRYAALYQRASGASPFNAEFILRRKLRAIGTLNLWLHQQGGR